MLQSGHTEAGTGGAAPRTTVEGGGLGWGSLPRLAPRFELKTAGLYLVRVRGLISLCLGKVALRLSMVIRKFPDGGRASRPPPLPQTGHAQYAARLLQQRGAEK